MTSTRRIVAEVFVLFIFLSIGIPTYLHVKSLEKRNQDLKYMNMELEYSILQNKDSLKIFNLENNDFQLLVSRPENKYWKVEFNSDSSQVLFSLFEQPKIKY